MHRIISKLDAWRAAEAEAKSLGKRNEAVIAGTVAEVLTKTSRMGATTGWELLDEVLEQAGREAANPVICNSARQRGLFKAIGELQEILPDLADTRFTGGDLADVTPQAVRSPT